MAAHERVSAQAITNALLRWGGNLSAAADDLGVSRNGLQKRIQSLGLDLPAFRSKVVNAITPFKVVTTMEATTMGGNRGHHRPKNAGANYPGAPQRSSLASMQTAEQEVATPIKAEAPRKRPLRLRQAHQERLREAKLDIGARFRIETNENLLLEQFFEESFETWLKAKLSEKKGK